MTFMLIALLIIGLALYETGYGIANSAFQALTRQCLIQVAACASFLSVTSVFAQHLLDASSLFVNIGFLIMLTYIITSSIPMRRCSAITAAGIGGLLFPVVLDFTGANGYLTSIGYADAAGAGLIHFLGGAVALMLALSSNRSIRHPACTRPYSATIGFMVLWLGWMGYVSVISLPVLYASPERWIMGMLNMMTGTAWGAVSAVAVAWFMYGKIAARMCTIGGLAGMVVMSADPFNAPLYGAILGGILGGIASSGTLYFLYKRNIPDIANSISIHFLPGAIGVFCAPLFNSSLSLSAQAVGLAILLILATICGLNINQVRKIT